MDLQLAIGKEGTRDNYVGTIWEGFCMVNNVAKKGFTIDIQTIEGLGHLVIETEEINKPMLSPEVISRVKGEALKPPDSTLTLDETIP